MMSNHRSYPAYKSSGVPWLDDMPEHWDVRRGGWLFRKMDRAVRDADEVITCFRDGTVTLRKNRRTEGFTESLKEIGYQGVRKGDLVIHQMDAFAGAVGVSDSDGKGTPVYSVCHPTQDANPFYYAHIVHEMARSQWILALAKGIRERSTDFRYSEFALQALPLPPLPEQAAIVRYLDYVDRRIRRYVSARRKLIALLEEEKQAIVDQSVTRGLDRNVSLKSSGVEWLGDVPEHWEVRRLKTLCQMKSGEGITAESIEAAGEYPVYGGNGLRGYTSLYTHDGAFALIGRQGALCGNVHIACGKFWATEHAVVATLGIGHDIDWFGAILTAMNLNQYSIAAAQPGLAVERVLNLHLTVPPKQEQKHIANQMGVATAEIDAAIARAQRQIELLQEYRTRLIADVVTGKLDVREAAAQLPDEPDDEEPIDEGRALADDADGDLYDAGNFKEELAMESEVRA